MIQNSYLFTTTWNNIAHELNSALEYAMQCRGRRAMNETLHMRGPLIQPPWDLLGPFYELSCKG